MSIPNLSIFHFDSQAIRSLSIENEPWFVAQDICRILEINNVSKALQRISEEDKGVITLSDIIGNDQNFLIINESGLYDLILGSRKLVAKPFRKWVTKEVLPSIRKTGSYQIPTKPKYPKFPDRLTGEIAETPVALFAKEAKEVIGIVLSDLPAELQQGILIEAVCSKNPELRSVLEPHKPKLLIDKPLVTPTQIGKLLEEKTGEKFSAVKVNKLLQQFDFQSPTGKKQPIWQPIGSGLEYGQIVADTAKGHGKTVMTCKWYESIVDRLLEKMTTRTQTTLF